MKEDGILAEGPIGMNHAQSPLSGQRLYIVEMDLDPSPMSQDTPRSVASVRFLIESARGIALRKSKKVKLVALGTVSSLSLGGCGSSPQGNFEAAHYVQNVYGDKAACLADGHPEPACERIESGTRAGYYRGPRFLFVPYLGGGGYYPFGGPTGAARPVGIQSSPAPDSVKSGAKASASLKTTRGGFGRTSSFHGFLGS